MFTNNIFLKKINQQHPKQIYLNNETSSILSDLFLNTMAMKENLFPVQITISLINLSLLFYRLTNSYC